MPTCDTCFDGRHYRCEDKHDCSCTVCAARWGGSKPAATPRKKTNREVETGRSEEDLAKKVLPDRPRLPEVRAPRTYKQHKTREVSEDPKLVARREYMREWRERKRAGEPTRAYNRTTDEDLAKMIELRAMGASVRDIAMNLDLDFSAVAKRLRKLDEESTA